MIRLVLLLLGADFIRRYWHVLAIVGAIWGVIGISLFIDALDGVLVFPLTLFGYLLLLESLATLFLASSGVGAQKTLRYVKGGLFLLISLLIISSHSTSNMLLAMLFGAAFAIGGCLQLASAMVVRFPNWRWAVAGGVGQIGIAIFFIQPYPTHYRGTIPYCLGIGLMFSGWSMVWLATRSRRLPPHASISELSFRNASSDRPLDAGLYPTAEGSAVVPAASGGEVRMRDPGATLTVHVWTPSGSARSATLNRPVVDRYIAAVDANGVISTGHAALEVQRDIYISLYPAQEIDRSPHAFARTLRATADNNVRGRYLTDYPSEAKSWCESTEKIVFRDYDLPRLHRFWQHYRREEIYIPSMTEAAAGLSEVKISRSTGVFYGLGGLELSINDVVLAELADGEHMSLWLKPGIYNFGIKPKHVLNGATEATAPVTLDVKSGSNYALRIAGSGGRITFVQGN